MSTPKINMLTVALAAFLSVAACEVTPFTTGPAGPIVVAPPAGPTAPPSAPEPDAPTEPGTPDPAPTGDVVLVSEPADSTAAPDTLSVPRLISAVAGDTVDLALRLAAGSAPREFELLVAIDDTTTVRSTIGQLEFQRGGLVPADEWGVIMAQADQIVPVLAEFDSRGFTTLAIPLEARAAGRALIHVMWQESDGQRLGLAVVEVRIR